MFSNMVPEKRLNTANYTISNCILEIPQNIKVTLENNVLTLKSGSIITLTGSTYTTYTTTVDRTYTISNSQTQGRYYIFASVNGIQAPISINKVSSGNTASQPTWDISLANSAYYNTDTKTLQYATGSQWIDWGVAYPLCMVDVDSNGVASFTKFSDGRDCIFNGLGFVGQTKFIYPNFKVLQPIGKNADGTLKSKVYTTDSLQLSTSGNTFNRRMFLNNTVFQVTANNWYYNENENMYYDQNNNPMRDGVVYLGNYFTVNDIVTDFTISQPVRTATVEMLENLNNKVDTVDNSAYHQPADEEVLFDGDAGSGDITLSEDFTNFEYLLLIYANDSNNISYSRMISSYELDKLLTVSTSVYCLAMQSNGSGYWFIENYNNGSNKTLLKYSSDDDILFHKIIGINRK